MVAAGRPVKVCHCNRQDEFMDATTSLRHLDKTKGSLLDLSFKVPLFGAKNWPQTVASDKYTGPRYLFLL